MIVERAVEPWGIAPGAPAGAGHQKIPIAARPQSPQPRDTEQLASTGPSPHRLHHLDMHAIGRMEKSTHRDPFSLGLCVALDLGMVFRKCKHPKVPAGFWSCWLQTPTLRKGWCCLNYCAIKQNPGDTPKWTPGTSFQPGGDQPGWNIVSVTRLWYSQGTILTHTAWKYNLGSKESGSFFFPSI